MWIAIKIILKRIAKLMAYTVGIGAVSVLWIPAIIIYVLLSYYEDVINEIKRAREERKERTDR